MARETLPEPSLSASAMPAVGKLFAGRYVIEALLGRGGMGSVYRARDREVGELVALKTLDGESVSEAAIERFRREARLARRVTHHNAARTYDLGEHAGLRFLTMEFIDGQSLREWLRGTRPSPAAAVEVALQIAAGLEAAHAAGVVHRDLEPSNILIEAGGRVVITDFGIARTVRDEAADATQKLLGSPAYMAPEQVENQQVDERTDLYALGLIVVEMLTGELPFRGDNPSAVALARLAIEQPELEQLASIPEALLEPLGRCLQRDRSRRYASAGEFAAALARVRALLAGDPNDSQHDTPTPGIATEAKALAVLPFRYRGPADSDYVPDALLDALTDVLSMTRGLKVSGSGATARFTGAGDRDPRLVGAELGVDVVVDGSIQLAGKRLRIAARLLDVHTGFQLWSERFDGELEDVFDLQDKLGQRIAEALRLELEILSHSGLADADAVESYLRARQAKLNWRLRGPGGAVFHYRQVLARAPSFRPAIAGLALAVMRAWFLPATDFDEQHDWAAEAKVAVELAMAEAPNFPDSLIAAASWAVQAADYPTAVQHLREALRIAPTSALAHEYLGSLQIEAGQAEKGLRHLELAFELEPRLHWCLAQMARHRALTGDIAGYRELMDRWLELSDPIEPAAHLFDLRIGAWTGDLDLVRQALARLDPNSPDIAVQSIRSYGPPLLEPYNPEALAEAYLTILEQIENGRTRTLLYQLWAEQSGFHGDRERTLEHLRNAAGIALVDLAWLDGCPLFADLRDDPRFLESRALVLARCQQIWASD